jgi:hypothetical protein
MDTQGIAGETDHRAGQVAARLSGALGLVRAGAHGAVARLQTMSDFRLGLLAVASVGLGAGARLAGAPRLVTLAAFTPASIVGYAIWSRPDPARV